MSGFAAKLATVTLADIEDARARIAGCAVVTPLLEAALLNRLVGGRVLVKAEPLQYTGSFKFRGAYNCISQIPQAERARGVVAYSSGNHALGVAAAAELLGVAATIVMPADAPAIKAANTRAHGANVIAYDRYHEVREEVARRLVADTGATLVKPYDDPHIIAGQGTVGLEVTEQAAALDAAPDCVLAPIGGGGLAAGVATALAAVMPDAQIYGVEPANHDDTRRSLAAGERLANKPDAPPSMCDALVAPTPGELTFAINRRLLAGAFAVSDAEVVHAMRVAFETLKLVVEPGGAVALAAVLAGKLDAHDKTVVVVCSGGNVDPALFADVLRGARP